MARIAGIVAQLSGPEKKSATESRRAPRVRHHVSFNAFVSSRLADGGSIEILCSDISVRGIGFYSRRLFKPSEQLAVSLTIQNIPAKLVLVRVKHCQYARKGMYRTGAEFVECIPDPTGAALPPDRWNIARGHIPTAMPHATQSTSPRPESASHPPGPSPHSSPTSPASAVSSTQPPRLQSGA
jgi:hypothetical protein